MNWKCVWPSAPPRCSERTKTSERRWMLVCVSKTNCEESERRYRAVVEDQTELITRFLPDGTITFANEACCRYFGGSCGYLVGTSYFIWLHEDDLHIEEGHRSALSPGKPRCHVSDSGAPGRRKRGAVASTDSPSHIRWKRSGAGIPVRRAGYHGKPLSTSM